MTADRPGAQPGGRPGARTYPHGVPCWVSTEQPDVEAALDFYRSLFGWEYEERHGFDGRYVVASLGGLAVAGIGAGDRSPEWVTYVAVDDVHACARGVPDLDGAVLDGPREVGDAGEVAVVRDPQGATFRLWQAGELLGAQRVNEPGTWNFSNLRTPDPEHALHFYGPLLGWEVSPDLGAGMARVAGYGDHLARTVDPQIHERQAFVPPGFADVVAGVEHDRGPARFSVVFAVAERDAAAERAERAGGTVEETSESPWTREAVVRDPQGAELVLSEFAPQGQP